MNLQDLQTPALLLDKEKLKHNLKVMKDHVNSLGVKFRPHLKTAKSLDIAQLALKDSSQGITVSTLNEAEYFAQNGYTDILYAVCITPDKFSRAAALLGNGIQLKVIVDTQEMAMALSQFGRNHTVVFPTLIEVDSGQHRTGMEIDDPEFIETGKALHLGEGTLLQGIMTHAGHSYNCKSLAQLKEVAEEERSISVRAGQRLIQASGPTHVVSG